MTRIEYAEPVSRIESEQRLRVFIEDRNNLSGLFALERVRNRCRHNAQLASRGTAGQIPEPREPATGPGGNATPQHAEVQALGPFRLLRLLARHSILDDPAGDAAGYVNAAARAALKQPVRRMRRISGVPTTQ